MKNPENISHNYGLQIRDQNARITIASMTIIKNDKNITGKAFHSVSLSR